MSRVENLQRDLWVSGRLGVRHFEELSNLPIVNAEPAGFIPEQRIFYGSCSRESTAEWVHGSISLMENTPERICGFDSHQTKETPTPCREQCAPGVLRGRGSTLMLG
jgi:hypothetical protein